MSSLITEDRQLANNDGHFVELPQPRPPKIIDDSDSRSHMFAGKSTVKNPSGSFKPNR